MKFQGNDSGTPGTSSAQLYRTSRVRASKACELEVRLELGLLVSRAELEPSLEKIMVKQLVEIELF